MSLLPLLPLFSYSPAPTVRPVPLFTLLPLLALLSLPPLLPCPPTETEDLGLAVFNNIFSCVSTVGQLHSHCTKLNIIMTILS